MYDIKRIRRDFDEILEAIEKRGKGDFGLLEIRELEKKRREILVLVEQLRNEQRTRSRLIPLYKKEGKDSAELLEELRDLSQRISLLDGELKGVEESFEELLYYVPNTPTMGFPWARGKRIILKSAAGVNPGHLTLKPKPTGI